MSSMKIRKGDNVMVISGKDKSSRPREVIEALPDESKVVVKGVNLVRKHVRPSRTNPQGGIVEVERPIHVSNVMLVPHGETAPTRVGRVRNENGRMVRVSKRTGAVIVNQGPVR